MLPRSLAYLARQSGVDVPPLPVHTSPEAKLFTKILNTHGGNSSVPNYKVMLEQWKQHVDGVQVFPKKDSHLRTYYRRWLVLCDKASARENSKSALKDVRRFLRKNASAVQFEFFRFGDDDVAAEFEDFEGHVDLVADAVEPIAAPPPALAVGQPRQVRGPEQQAATGAPNPKYVDVRCVSSSSSSSLSSSLLLLLLLRLLLLLFVVVVVVAVIISSFASSFPKTGLAGRQTARGNGGGALPLHSPRQRPAPRRWLLPRRPVRGSTHAERRLYRGRRRGRGGGRYCRGCHASAAAW